MKKLFTIALLVVVSSAIFAQQTDVKRVAILETVDKMETVEYIIELMFRSNLTTAITETAGYEGYDRVDLAQITGEQDFQRTGLVSDADIKKIGEFTGAKYVLIAEAVSSKAGKLFITAKLIDVETARIIRNSNELMDTDEVAMQAGSKRVAATLLGNNTASNTTRPNPTPRTTSPSNQNFTETVNGVSFTMVYVEGGTFTMGCTSEQGSDCSSNEKPAHSVTLSAYYIGETEVTQGLWRAVMGDNPSYFKKGDDYPVEQVSWQDAMAFCSRLSELTGNTYTLPTEAQWEYAARGGNKSRGYKYAGSDYLESVGWYGYNSGSTIHPVKRKSPNSLGIYDMSGNVYEWCKDWYGEYSSSSQTNPTGASSGSYRVLRGGSWYNNAQCCRVAYRVIYTPTCRIYYFGFRVVLLR